MACYPLPALFGRLVDGLLHLTCGPIMARVARPARAHGMFVHSLAFVFTCFVFLKPSQQTRCAQGTTPCGLACVAPESECRDGRCWDASGRQVLCYPSFHVCGDTVCPLFSWCNGGQCLPNTCAHRHKAWCPEDTGALTAVKCIKQAPKTQCYASTGGKFSCHVGPGLIVAKCGSRMAVAMAAVQQHSPKQPRVQRLGQLFSQIRSSSTAVQQGQGRLYASSSHSVPNILVHSMRRTLLQYGNTLSAIFTGMSSIGSVLGLGRGGLYDRMYDTSMLSDITSNAKYSYNPYRTSSSGSSLDNSYSTGAKAKSGDLNVQGYMDGGYANGKSGYGYQDPASSYQQSQTSYQQSVYASNSNKYKAGLSQTGKQYSTGAQDSSVASFTPAIGSTQTTVQPGSSAGAFIQAGSGGQVAGSYGGGYSGAYSSGTGIYGPGGSYGYPTSYQGKASGKAVVFMPAWFGPNKPNITYPCLDGMPTGSMISVGIPCGIPMISVDAAQLPTVDGLPAAVDLSKSGLVQNVDPYFGVGGAAYVPSSAATTQEAGMTQPVISDAYRATPMYTGSSNMRLGDDNGPTSSNGGGDNDGKDNGLHSITVDSGSDVSQMLSFMSASAGSGAAMEGDDVVPTTRTAQSQTGSHNSGGSAAVGSNGSNGANDYMALLLTTVTQGDH